MILCPDQITVTLDPGQVSASVSWAIPAAVDPSGVSTISNFEPGATFGLGTTEVRYIFTDGNGNQAFCNFNVEVIMPQGDFFTSHKICTLKNAFVLSRST